MSNLPLEYLNQMQTLLRDDYQAYLDSFDNERVYGLRVNTNKISVEDFLKICPFELKPIPWTSNGFYYNEDVRPAKHPYYYAGLYYLQEPSAMTPAEIMPIEENDRVLDTCAAPGGKSTELGAKLNGSGLLISNDISNSRAQALLKNIEHFGIKNSFVISEDLVKLEKHFPNYFDKILIDAPCSGEGMFRKDPSIIKTWIELGNDYYVKLQKAIVESALKMLKDGGMIVYSTCTFAIKEDEEIIAYMQSLCPELKVLSINNRYEGFAKGVNGYDDAIRIYPHKVDGEGHFVILLQKGEKKINDIYQPLKVNKVKDEAANEFLKLIDMEFKDGTFETKSDKLYFIPNINKELKGVRILRSGLLIGETKNGRFEPSQALALALKKSEFKNILDFEVNDNRVMRYLKGETLDVSDLTTLKGWVLVCVSGYPLGFAKIDNGTLKNKLAKGWRIQ